MYSSLFDRQLIIQPTIIKPNPKRLYSRIDAQYNADSYVHFGVSSFILDVRCLSRVRLEQALELGGIGANKVVNLLAVLEEEEGGDGADTELLSDFGYVVDVKLDKVYRVLEFVRVGVPGRRRGLVFARSSFAIGGVVAELTFPGWGQWPCKEGTSRRRSRQ